MVRLSRLDRWVITVISFLLLAVAVIAHRGQSPQSVYHIAYLYPALGDKQNIWLVPWDNRTAARPITQSSRGVYDFDVHPDGRSLIFAERNEATTTDLKRVTIANGSVQTLLDCAAQKADCKNPTIHPDGRLLAYERSEQNLANRYGAVRIWLLDLDTLATQPLFSDSQIIGHSPVWSADGRKIAFLTTDLLRQGVMVYDLAAADGAPSMKLIPTQHNSMGALSPGGDKIAYFDIAEGQPHIFIADLQTNRIIPISAASKEADSAFSWHPHQDQLAIVRGRSGKRGGQIDLLDVMSQTTMPLLIDEDYTASEIRWDADGQRLLIERYLHGQGFRPQIWVWDMASKRLSLAADEAFLGQWVIPRDR